MATRKTASKGGAHMMPEMAKGMGMPNKMPMPKMPMPKMPAGEMMPGAKHKGPMMKGGKGK